MPVDLTRRQIAARIMAAGAIALGSRGFALAADAPLELEWRDLVPPDEQSLLADTLRGLGIVEHGQLSLAAQQPEGGSVVNDYNGKRVRIPGYAVPLEFSGTGITSFILVPYIGACIHVPPPPANQLVFVETTEPFISESMWDPIFATGMFTAAEQSTELAQIGYSMTEAQTEPYS